MKRTALICGGTLFLFSLLLLNTARSKSMVYDEIIYPAVGVLYWQGDARWNPEHPPLQKLAAGLPLLTQRLAIPAQLSPQALDSWRAGYLIFFGSETPAERLLFLSRLPTIALTLLLGFFIFSWARSLSSFAGGVFALLLFALDPLVLGNGALALNDMFVTAFMFFAVMAFHKGASGLRRAFWWCGLFSGAAIASKFSGLLLLPIFAVLAMVLAWRGAPLKRLVADFFAIWATAALVLLIVYKFDVSLLKDSFLAGTRLHAGDNALGFLLVPLSGRSGWYFFPIAMLIKTPLPILLLWGWGLIQLIKGASADGARRFLLVPVAFAWLAALISANHFGVRYLLPATPFLAVAAGVAIAPLLNSSKRTGALIIMSWLAVETVITHPHHMAYFNQLIGGSRNGYKWLDGSNQDWGQDLPALADFLKKEGHPGLLLSYVGSGRPEAWGLEYQDVLSPAITSGFHQQTLLPVDGNKEYLAVSAALRAKPPWAAVFSWLDERTPKAVLGQTIFVYDISMDSDAAEQLANIYRLYDRPHLEKRQRARAAWIQERQ